MRYLSNTMTWADSPERRNHVSYIWLMISAFVSQSGNHFFMLTLAGYIYLLSNSAVQASLVFVFSFVPATLVSSHIGHRLDRRLTKRTVGFLSLALSMLFMVCALFVYKELPIIYVCLALSGMSICSFALRTAFTKIVKEISEARLQTKRIKLFYMTFFLSTALSGVLAGALLGEASVFLIATIASALVLSGYLILSCRFPTTLSKAIGADSNASTASLYRSLKEILSTRSLERSFLLVAFSQAVFQGAYSVLVSYLPITHLNLGSSGVGIAQVYATAGIISGFLLVWILPRFLLDRDDRAPVRSLVFWVLGLIALIFLTLIDKPSLNLLIFLLLNFFYECIWLHNNALFFANSPSSKIGEYQFVLSSISALLMGVTILIYALLLEYFSFLISTAIFLSIGTILFYLSLMIFRKPIKISSPAVQTEERHA